MAYSITYANKVLAKIFNGTAFSFTPYLSLHTSDPGATGASEVSGGSYARVNASTLFGTAATTGSLSISSGFSITGMPGVTVTHVGIWDAASSGNFVEGGPLTAPMIVASGQGFSVSSGQLTIGFSDSPLATAWTTYLRNAVLNYMYLGTAFSATPYASLHTGAPGGTGANEVTGGSYARFALTMASPTNGGTSNTNSGSTANMPAVTVSYQGIFDASTAGNFLMSAAYSSSISVAAAATFTWNAGDISATLT